MNNEGKMECSCSANALTRLLLQVKNDSSGRPRRSPMEYMNISFSNAGVDTMNPWGPIFPELRCTVGGILDVREHAHSDSCFAPSRENS